MDAVQLAAGHGQVARRLGAGRQYHRIVIAQNAFGRNIDADMAVRVELDAFGAHLGDAPVDHALLQLEIRDAVAQQAADARRLFEDLDLVAGAAELLGAGQAGRTGADHGDALAGMALGDLRLDPAFAPAALDDGMLDRLDRHRLADQVQRAGRLARRRADPAGEIREVVGLVQDGQRTARVVLIDPVVPFRMMLLTGQPVWQNGIPQSMQRPPWRCSSSSASGWVNSR